MSQKGDLAKVHRIIRNLDALIELTSDETAFSDCHWHEINAMIDSLVRARMCAANIALTCGDPDPYRTTPRIQMRLV